MISGLLFVGDPLGISNGGFGWFLNWVRLLVFSGLMIIGADWDLLESEKSGTKVVHCLDYDYLCAEIFVTWFLPIINLIVSLICLVNFCLTKMERLRFASE